MSIPFDERELRLMSSAEFTVAEDPRHEVVGEGLDLLSAERDSAGTSTSRTLLSAKNRRTAASLWARRLAIAGPDVGLQSVIPNG